MKTILAVLAMVPTLALADEPGEGRNGANEAISARSRAGAEFDRVTAPPVLNEEVPAPTPAPTQLDEPAPEVPTTPEEEAVAAEAAEEFARQPGETRTDHVRRLLEERALLSGQIGNLGDGDNTVIQVIGWDNTTTVTAELRAAAAAEQARLETIDADLRAVRARLTALEAALETAAAERRDLRGDLDALDQRVTTEVARIDADTDLLAGYIANNNEEIEALIERTVILEATDREHATRLDGHDSEFARTRKGTQHALDIVTTVRGSSHGLDVAIGLGKGWATSVGEGAWISENQIVGTFHPLNQGVGAGFTSRFMAPVTSEVPVYCGPEVGIHHAGLGWTDGGGRASGALTTLRGGLHCGLRPQKGAFSAGLTLGGDVGYLGWAGPDTGTWAPGGIVGGRIGWSW